MRLIDKNAMKGTIGVFKIQSFDKDDNLIDEYEDKNLIVDTARQNMAQLVGGVNSGSLGEPIDKFVIGTLGHKNGNILTPKEVGDDGFDGTRTRLFSEETAGAINYRIEFDATGDEDVTVQAEGKRYEGDTLVHTDASLNTVQRVVNDKTVSYKITIPVENANDSDETTPVAYTEAGLYAGSDFFSMKTLIAVKEGTVKFIINWSIIF